MTKHFIRSFVECLALECVMSTFLDLKNTLNILRFTPLWCSDPCFFFYKHVKILSDFKIRIILKDLLEQESIEISVVKF